MPPRLLQGHNWAYTSAASGVSGKFQEEKPPMTRERQRPTQAESHWSPLASRDRRSPTPEFLGKKRQIGPPRRCSSSKQCGASSWMVPSASLQHQQAAGKLKRINEAEGTSDRAASTRKVQLHAALQPAVYCSWCLFGQDAGTPGQMRSREQDDSSMAARRQASSGASMVPEV